MVKLDYLYVTNWSLWIDIRLLLKTLPAVFSGAGRTRWPGRAVPGSTASSGHGRPGLRPLFLRGNVAGHDGSRADHGPLADRDPAEDRRTGADRSPRARPQSSRSQSPGPCSRPSTVARGRLSLTNITPWPMNTSSSIDDPGADEGVALDLAAGPDRDLVLDLDERPDRVLVADLAAVEVGEAVNDHAVAESAVPEQPMGGVIARSEFKALIVSGARAEDISTLEGVATRAPSRLDRSRELAPPAALRSDRRAASKRAGPRFS